MKQHTTQYNTRLGGYLTAAVSCGTVASTASAAVVQLDISSISGPNAGVASLALGYVTFNSLGASIPGGLGLYNNVFEAIGISPGIGGGFASAGAGMVTNFSKGDLIDSASNFSAFRSTTTFYSYSYLNYSAPDIYTSPDFGPDSFIGFRTADDRYGWLEVTWDSNTYIFQILGGAIEDQPGVGIQAGAIPEPSTAVLSLGALAAGVFRRRRKQAA